MYAENLAKMSIPAVFDSGCLAPSLINLEKKNTKGVHIVTIKVTIWNSGVLYL